MKSVLRLCIILVVLLTFISCLPGDGASTIKEPAGFIWGVWHGWIAPVSLIVSYFDRDISIYESINNGFIYDLGFYLAILGGFGGFRLFRKSRERREDR